jgi:hypothetical protein
VAITMLPVAALWFAFLSTARWWPVWPGFERLVIVLVTSVLIGIVWPGVRRSLAAAAAAAMGIALSLAVIGSPFEAGDANQLPTIVLTVALLAFYAQLIGSAIRFGIKHWRGATA